MFSYCLYIFGPHCTIHLLISTRSRLILTDAAPLGVIVLSPQTDFVVASAHSQQVPSSGPADVPRDILERVQDLRGPVHTVIAAPDDDPPVLATTCDLCTLQANGRRPCHITHPVRVQLQTVLLHPSICGVLSPDLDQVIASTSGQSLYRHSSLFPIAIAAQVQRRTPAHGIAADGMRIGDLMRVPGVPVQVACQYRDRAIRTATGQHQTVLLRRPSHGVDGGVMSTVLVPRIGKCN